MKGGFHEEFERWWQEAGSRPMNEGIKVESERRLSPILRKWISLNKAMAAAWKWEECPWWCNERASVSIFAAAVWKAGGIALEEFCDEKVYRRSRYKGRCDLYFKFRGKEYTAEAKHIWSAAGPRSNGAISPIEEALRSASDDVKHVKETETKLSIVFAVPYFPKSCENELDLLLKKWRDQLLKISCYNMAWVFPKKARRALISKNEFYPGAAVILRKA